MSAPLVYLNGRFVRFQEAGLPLHDAGFVSGATIIDNARTFRGKLFRWKDHLERFRRDCRACYVPLEHTDEQLTDIAAELIAENAKLLPPDGELQVATFATPGPLGFYLGSGPSGPATLGMVTYPLPFARYRRFFTEGITLAAAGSQSFDPGDLLPPGVKHRSRLFWHIAERRINDPASRFQVPGAVPVVLDQKGIGDTAIGCVLAVAGDTVILPVPGTVQDSISATVVRELCARLGLRCEDQPLDLREFCRPGTEADQNTIIPRVSELLLAGTGFCIAGVQTFSLGPRMRNYTWPGPIYRALLDAWSELVGLDVAGQFAGREG
jgi:branched-chain amino acid aminotransferase